LQRTAAAAHTRIRTARERRQQSVPTGNAAPDFLKAMRPGDNLYTSSIVALDLQTGELKAARQLVTSHDFHDWDVAAPRS
jgi:alcohol dehydrogenase (cytochrome c)